MIRGLFRLLYRLIALAVLIVVATAVWIVADGLNDAGAHADVAVVLGNAIQKNGVPAPILRGRLDKAIELYDKGEFPLIIVSGATRLGGDEPAAMCNYLVEHQVPITVIVQDRGGANTDDTSEDVERIAKERNLRSVMIITDYYHVTRTKLALHHAGVADVEQAHSGVVKTEDAPRLAREILALYFYVGKFYLMPWAHKAQAEAQVDSEKLKEQAQIEAEKLKEDADKAKDNVQQQLQSGQK
jgi:vancomycin permeability regulator SanA